MDVNEATVRHSPASEPVRVDDEMPPGYKHTEVGVIPEDWDSRRLGEIATFANGHAHEREVTSHGTFSLITIDSIGIDGELKGDHRRVDLFDGSLLKGDIVTVLSDIAHGNLLGLCDVIPRNNAFVLNQRMGRLRTIDTADAQFVRREINRRQDHFRQRGQGTSQRHVYQRDFDALLIPFPPLAEQRAIATALGNVDALLDGLDRLIAKKRDLKQAAMQQLLTGQTRLPGFTAEWEVKRLGEISDIHKGSGLSRSLLSVAGVNACVLYGELFTTYGRVITSVASRTNSSEGVLSISGDVLMPGSTTTTGIDLATASALMLDGVSLGGDINIIRRKTGCLDPAFLASYLTQVKRQAIAEVAQGITIHHLYGRDLNALVLKVPLVAEQTAIAAVLSDMDAEITALEARRAKTRDLKQAMMQELLTGRTRLVKPAIARQAAVD